MNQIKFSTSIKGRITYDQTPFRNELLFNHGLHIGYLLHGDIHHETFRSILFLHPDIDHGFWANFERALMEDLP